MTAQTYFAHTAQELIELVTADGREFEVEREEASEFYGCCGYTSVTVKFDKHGFDARCYTFYDDGDFEFEPCGWDAYGEDL